MFGALVNAHTTRRIHNLHRLLFEGQTCSPFQNRYGTLWMLTQNDREYVYCAITSKEIETKLCFLLFLAAFLLLTTEKSFCFPSLFV